MSRLTLRLAALMQYGNETLKENCLNADHPNLINTTTSLSSPTQVPYHERSRNLISLPLCPTSLSKRLQILPFLVSLRLIAR